MKRQSSVLPPDNARTIERIVERNARRLARVQRRLEPRNATEREALRALAATRAWLSGVQRTLFLFGPDLRAWLDAGEEALFFSHPPRSERALLERLAHGPWLGTVLPSGRFERASWRRARALGRRLQQDVLRRLPLVLAFNAPPGRFFGPFPLRAEAEGEEGRAQGEFHMPFPVPLTLTIEGPARLALDSGAPVPGGGAPRWSLRPVIEGSGIILARRAIAGRSGLRPGPRVAGLERRLGLALGLVRRAWPEAWREILLHTCVVIPVKERGTVSYSQQSRPRVSYINVEGKSLVDLADDLLHETAHHRLHALEELGPLVKDDGEPRYVSAWRGTLRPLRGILHGAYTFTWRAELFARMLALDERLPRAWIARQLRLEVDALVRTLDDLAGARRLGLLTPEGARLCGALATRIANLRRSQSRRRAI